MKDARPQLPSGDSPRMFFARRVWFALWGGRFPFANSDTVTVEFTNGHYSFKAKSGQGGGGSSKLAIRGEYSSGITYSLYDIAIISTGDNAGTYVWINSNPGSGVHPTTGAPNWMQLPMGTVGAWL